MRVKHHLTNFIYKKFLWLKQDCGKTILLIKYLILYILITFSWTGFLVLMIFSIINQITENVNDSGIIFQIIGFFLFIPIIRSKLTVCLIILYPDNKPNYVKEVLFIFTIIMICIGLFTQLSIFI